MKNLYLLPVLFAVVLFQISCKDFWHPEGPTPPTPEQVPNINVNKDADAIDYSGEYNFGTISVGRPSDVTFSILNSGNANLNIEEVNRNLINILNNSDGHFEIILQPSAVVSPGNSVTFSIRFNPMAVGNNFTATVQIRTNCKENGGIFSFVIRGNGKGYEIGDEGPGGGTIFFAQSNQFKECSGELGTYNWNQARTRAMNFQGGMFSDWQLPDRGELDLMYQNLHKKGLGGFFNEWYWSSTFSSRTNIGTYLNPKYIEYYYAQTFHTSGTLEDDSEPGSQVGWRDDIALRVRAVRSFP